MGVSAAALPHLASIVWLMQQAIELAGNSPAAAIPTSWLGLVKYEQNDLEEAARNLQLANELNELGGQADNRIHNHFHLAQIHLARGDVWERPDVIR